MRGPPWCLGRRGCHRSGAGGRWSERRSCAAPAKPATTDGHSPTSEWGRAGRAWSRPTHPSPPGAEARPDVERVRSRFGSVRSRPCLAKNTSAQVHRAAAPPGGWDRGPTGYPPQARHKEILDRLARSKVCGAIRVADHCRSLPRGATKTSARGRSWRRWTFEFCQSGARRLATFSRQAGPPTSVLYFRHSNLRSNRRDIRPILRSKCSNTVARRTSGWLVQRANQARRAPYQLVSP